MGMEAMFVANILPTICMVGSSPRLPIAHQQLPSGLDARRRVSVGAENPSCFLRLCHSSKTQNRNVTDPAITPPAATTTPIQAAIVFGSSVKSQSFPLHRTERHLVVEAIVETSDPAAHVVSHFLRDFELAPVSEKLRDAGAREAMKADFCLGVGRARRRFRSSALGFQRAALTRHCASFKFSAQHGRRRGAEGIFQSQ